MLVPFATAAHHADHLAPILARLDDVGDRRTGPGDIALVPSYGELVKARRQRFGRIILAQHGAGQSYAGATNDRKAVLHPGLPGGRDNDDVGLFLVPNEHAANRWRKAYPRAAVEVVGCPKLDELPAREPGPGPVVAISFHWNAHFSPEASSAWDHFRTALRPLAEAFTVIGHAHPLRHDLPTIYRNHGIEYVKHFADVCRRADVYVCDNSSTIFEFASTGRPVVLLDSPRYRRHVHHGLRFWEASGVGVHCDAPERLVDAVTEALADRHPEARDEALAVVYAPGGAERAADAIRAWA